MTAGSWGIGQPLLFVGLTSVGATAAILLYWFRWHSITRVKTDESVHQLVHFVRDRLPVILKKRGSSVTEQAVDHFHNEVAERIATIFRHRLKRGNIGCAIRIAEVSEGVECYVTMGRSNSLDVSRLKGSKAVRKDEGIASLLRKKETKGIFIVRSILKAIDDGDWEPQPNDACPDVRSVMIAPINSIEAGVSTTIGILYITSPKPVFHGRHSSLLKGVSDLLGLVYPQLFAKIAAERSKRPR